MENINKEIDAKGIIKENNIPEVRLKLVRTGNYIKYNKSLESTVDYNDFVRNIISDFSREIVLIIIMDYDLYPVNYAVVAVGGLDEVTIDTRMIYKLFYMSGGVRFSLLHNHPYSDSRASEADLKFTLNIVKQCELLDIEFVDNIIIGSTYERDYRSLRTWYPEIWDKKKIVHEYSKKDGHKIR